MCGGLLWQLLKLGQELCEGGLVNLRRMAMKIDVSGTLEDRQLAMCGDGAEDGLDIREACVTVVSTGDDMNRDRSRDVAYSLDWADGTDRHRQETRGPQPHPRVSQVVRPAGQFGVEAAPHRTVEILEGVFQKVPRHSLVEFLRRENGRGGTETLPQDHNRSTGEFPGA